MNRIRTIILLLAILWGTPSIVCGQGVVFLDVNPDAENWGMGNGLNVWNANAFSIYGNVAIMSFSEIDGAIGYSYMPWMKEWLSGSNIHAIGGFYHKNRQGIGGGIRLFRGVSYETMDGNGIYMNTYHPKEFSIDLAYSYGISDCFSLGIAFHYIHSKISSFNSAQNGKAVAFDIDALYKSVNWSVGIAMKNWGTEIGYGFGNYELPAELRLGGCYRYFLHPLHTLTGQAGMDYRVLPSDFSGIETSIGLEYGYNNLIAVQWGYHFGNAERTGPDYMTFGCGFQYGPATLNAAYVVGDKNCTIRNNFTLSATWNF